LHTNSITSRQQSFDWKTHQQQFKNLKIKTNKLTNKQRKKERAKEKESLAHSCIQTYI